MLGSQQWIADVVAPVVSNCESFCSNPCSSSKAVRYTTFPW